LVIATVVYFLAITREERKEKKKEREREKEKQEREEHLLEHTVQIHA
jgi:large-conductance mechanosensitive channel